MNRIRIYGYGLLACSLIMASMVPIAFKLGSAIPATTLLFYVTIVGTVTSFVMMLARKGSLERLKNIFHDRTHLAVLCAVGILAYVIEPFAFGYGTHFVSADLAAVVFRTWPLLLLLLAPIVIRERTTKWDIIGASIGFLGLAVVLIGGTAISIPASELPFVGIILIAAFADAFSNAISKRYNYDLISSIFFYNLLALIIFIPIVISTNTWQLTISTPSVIFGIIFIGTVFFALFGYVFYESLRIVKTALASTSYIACSFITMLLSYVLLGEAIQPSYMVIAIAVVGGVLVQKLAPKGTGNFVTSKKKEAKGYYGPLYDVTGAFLNTKHLEIYKNMKGGGRVLAFYVAGSKASSISKEQLSDISGMNCILFTDKHNSIASSDEIEFIREILGCTEEHLLVMGSGYPEIVTSKFSEVNNILK